MGGSGGMIARPRSEEEEDDAIEPRSGNVLDRLRGDGIEVSDARDYFSDVVKTGPGGHFLATPNTMKACRSEEFFRPTLGNRNSYEMWEAAGQPGVYQEARKKVEEILSSAPKKPLPDDVVGKLEEIMRRAAEDLPA